MLFINCGSDAGPYPPNMTTLSSEILVNEKSLHGGGVLPVTMGLDQHPVVKRNCLVAMKFDTILQVVYSLE